MALVGTFARTFVLQASFVVTACPSHDSSVDTEKVVSKAVRLRPSTEPYRNLLTPLPTFHSHRTLLHACFAFNARVVAVHLALLNPQTRAFGFRPPVFMIESRASVVLVCCPSLGHYDVPRPQCPYLHRKTPTFDLFCSFHYHCIPSRFTTAEAVPLIFVVAIIASAGSPCLLPAPFGLP